MASSLSNLQHNQITSYWPSISPLARLNGYTVNGQTMRFVLNLHHRALGSSHSVYFGGAVFSPLHPTYLARGHMRARLWMVRAVNSRGSRQHSYYQPESMKAVSPTPAGKFIGLAVGAGLVLAVVFALLKLTGTLFNAATSNMDSTGIDSSLSAGGNKLQRQSRARLSDFAKELRLLRSVDMSGRNFGDEGLIFLAESLAFNQSAEEVDFSANGITAVGLKALSDILPLNGFMKALNLSGNPVGDEGAKDISIMLERNRGLLKLQLNSANIGDEGAKALAEMLKKNSSLSVIELNNNMIDYSGFSALAEALIENKTIRAIHLNGNYGGALGASAFAKGLEVNKSLREVHLHGNGIGNEGARALILGLVAHRGKISTVDIGNNSIGSKGAFHIAEYIKKSKSLLWLNLYMNDIGDEGTEKIAKGLKQNRTLTTIDLGGNNIHADGASHLAEALKDNSVLTTLELSYNPIGPEGVKALAEVLKFSGNIQTLKLGWCQVGVELQPVSPVTTQTKSWQHLFKGPLTSSRTSPSSDFGSNLEQGKHGEIQGKSFAVQVTSWSPSSSDIHFAAEVTSSSITMLVSGSVSPDTSGFISPRDYVPAATLTTDIESTLPSDRRATGVLSSNCTPISAPSHGPAQIASPLSKMSPQKNDDTSHGNGDYLPPIAELWSFPSLALDGSNEMSEQENWQMWDLPQYGKSKFCKPFPWFSPVESMSDQERNLNHLLPQSTVQLFAEIENHLPADLLSQLEDCSPNQMSGDAIDMPSVINRDNPWSNQPDHKSKVECWNEPYSNLLVPCFDNCFKETIQHSLDAAHGNEYEQSPANFPTMSFKHVLCLGILLRKRK